MVSTLRFQMLTTGGTGYGLVLGLLALLAGAGLAAAWYMESQGHWVTGMDNQVVWGLPHVFAVYLILAASGALNAASVSSVFGRTDYTPMARLSGLLAITLLIGGLTVLVLDLGRPDRLIVAMTYYNFKSIFAWNIFLYTGFIVLVAVYLWMMMEPQMNRYTARVGLIALCWRLVLTSGTGAIFGFLVAREAYDTAIMAPMFIAMSLAQGTAIFLLVSTALFHWTGYRLDDERITRLGRLLAIFVLAVLYLVLLHHLTNLYVAQHHGVERFILLEGGVYTVLFWGAQVVGGSVLPVWLLLSHRFSVRGSVVTAALLVVFGGLAQLYVIIIGGQAYPLNIVPGYRLQSSFFDGVIAHYTPSLPELALGLGGVGVAGLLSILALRVLPFIPVAIPTPSSVKER